MNDIELVIDERSRGENPKVANLFNMKARTPERRGHDYRILRDGTIEKDRLNN